MVQIYGKNYSGTAIVTSDGELLTTGSVVANVGSEIPSRQLTEERIQTEMLNELKLIKTQLELITGQNITETEI